MKNLIFKKVMRVTNEFIETLEVFSDGTIEFAVYYKKNVVNGCN